MIFVILSSKSNKKKDFEFYLQLIAGDTLKIWVNFFKLQLDSANQLRFSLLSSFIKFLCLKTLKFSICLVVLWVMTGSRSWPKFWIGSWPKRVMTQIGHDPTGSWPNPKIWVTTVLGHDRSRVMTQILFWVMTRTVHDPSSGQWPGSLTHNTIV
jgi:hypothetical protein